MAALSRARHNAEKVGAECNVFAVDFDFVVVSAELVAETTQLWHKVQETRQLFLNPNYW